VKENKKCISDNWGYQERDNTIILRLILEVDSEDGRWMELAQDSIASFSIRSVEPSGSGTRELIT
jgi:hypothetical protein